MVEDELALAIRRLLTGHPGMSAREIAREVGFDKRSTNSYLYRNIGVYGRVRDFPPRWSVAQGSGGLLQVVKNCGTADFRCAIERLRHWL